MKGQGSFYNSSITKTFSTIRRKHNWLIRGFHFPGSKIETKSLREQHVYQKRNTSEKPMNQIKFSHIFTIKSYGESSNVYLNLLTAIEYFSNSMRLKKGDVVTVCDGQMSNYAYQYYSEAPGGYSFCCLREWNLKQDFSKLWKPPSQTI